MLLSDTFLFGKFKGKTLEETLATEEGQNWLWWYVDTPDNPNDKWCKRNMEQKKVIKRKLEKLDNPKIEPHELQSHMFIAGELEDLKARVVALETKAGIVNMKEVKKNLNDGWE